jgi:hypothetical protein
VARFGAAIGVAPGEGLLAVYKEGSDFEVVALDAAGRNRPDWAAAFRHRRTFDVRPLPDEPAGRQRWTAMVRRLASRLDPARRPYAVAALVVGP